MFQFVALVMIVVRFWGVSRTSTVMHSWMLCNAADCCSCWRNWCSCTCCHRGAVVKQLQPQADYVLCMYDVWRWWRKTLEGRRGGEGMIFITNVLVLGEVYSLGQPWGNPTSEMGVSSSYSGVVSYKNGDWGGWMGLPRYRRVPRGVCIDYYGDVFFFCFSMVGRLVLGILFCPKLLLIRRFVVCGCTFFVFVLIVLGAAGL